MSVDIQKFEEKLARLRRNEEKTTPEERRTKYAAAFKNFKSDVARDASEILRTFCIGDLIIDPEYKTDLDAKKEVDEMVSRINTIIDEEKSSGEFRRLSKILFKTYSLDSFLDAAAGKLTQRIWFEGYGPYWAQQCGWIDDIQAYWNPLIKMRWYADCGVWVSDDGLSFTLMLPPTIDLIREEERKWMQRESQSSV